MSTTEPLAGFVTRPKASKAYNRSQRQLERDLQVAYAIGNPELLAHYKVATKDGEVHDAQDVTVEQVKHLVEQGKVPVWYVEESYLEKKFGRKGAPRPDDAEHESQHNGMRDPVAKVPGSKSEDVGRDHRDNSASLVTDVDFLKERIRVLEREKQREQERHDEIVAKLFAQLAVKDKQISAWDEVTQGLTRGLATGQITPILRSGAPQEPVRQGDAETAAAESPPRTTADAVGKDAPRQPTGMEGTSQPASKQTRSASRTGGQSQRKRSARKRTRKTTATRGPKRAKTAAKKKQAAAKRPEPTLLEEMLPTFSRFFRK